MVGVSCNRYEDRLLQLFEDLEASRGQGMGTPGGKTRSKSIRELKRLECPINYDIKGGKSSFKMISKIISWNVRGLNEPGTRLGVRNLLRKWRADLVCLQETKVEDVSRDIVSSLWGGQHVGYQFLGSSGASGGILIVWDTRVFDMEEVSEGLFSLSISFRNIEDSFRWMFVGVYGPNVDEHRSGLWAELAGMMAWWNLPTCIGGDFNVIRFPTERSSRGRLTRAMEDFSDFIRENDWWICL
ncbi:uncharacterized protein LOC111382408 [Olea europaea var. sylvestris]|uniref:uncharacterized protein LOC111382408 n=1 Tax=Olea europaea var. sylvestris TaxID=158386 RepID=UPI000C1CDC34|nr:uncharacterized protein LOC111382408 [Olea europaea var. sylvestris]